MASWRAALETYREPRLLAILLMGFSSGLPLPLTVGTLSFWLAQSGVSRTAIGLFALIGISYNFKFVWSPLIDRLPIPLLTRWLGRRRSWALAIQALLALAILTLGFTDPGSAPLATVLAAVVVAFLSASQDIVIDAYRIELLTAGGAGRRRRGDAMGLSLRSPRLRGRRALCRDLRRLELRLFGDGAADGRRHGDGAADPGARGAGAGRRLPAPTRVWCAGSRRRWWRRSPIS